MTDTNGKVNFHLKDGPTEAIADLRERRSPSTSDSESDGDDDEEEEDFRKEIKPILNLGRTLTALWPISLFEQVEGFEDALAEFQANQDDGSADHYRGLYDDSVQVKAKSRSLPITRHRRAPSFPQRYHLDDIQLNSDYEYGFNHQRSRTRSLVGLSYGQYGNQKKGRDHGRPSSLHVDQTSLGSCDILADLCFSDGSITLPPYTSHFRKRSHAQNETEARLEEEIHRLRAQPSNVKFCRKSSFQPELTDDVLKPIRGRKSLRRSLKRRLSFDSHPRRKTFADDRNTFRLKRNVSHFKHHNKCQWSQESDSTDNDLSPILADPKTFPNGDLDTNNSDTYNKLQPIKLSPPPTMNEKIETDFHVSGASDGKEKRRRPTIPQFLTAFKFPNKKAIKKFMKRKNDREVTDISTSTEPEQIDSKLVDTESEPSPGITEAASVQSVNTFERTTAKDSSLQVITRKVSSRKDKALTSYGAPLSRKSCSACSLPRVDEGKECLEFEGSLPRKACSSCINIFAVKFFRGGFSKEDRRTLKRRMSDPVLSWEEPAPGCSPARPFLRKFLTPILCGFASDKYLHLQSDSYLSLNSDNASISSFEQEFTSQQLFGFDPADVSKELALVDKELLIRITWEELSNCGWMSKNKYESSPNVMNMVEFFNRVAMLVASSILAEDAIHLRAKTISRAIKLASKCKEIQNFNSLKAILGGLQCTPIYRLVATWKQVSSRRKRTFKELSKLMSEAENFSAYRDDLCNAVNKPPCLPFLGDFLTQIAQTQAYLAVKRKLQASVENGTLKREKKEEPAKDLSNSFEQLDVLSLDPTEDEKIPSDENQPVQIVQINREDSSYEPNVATGVDKEYVVLEKANDCEDFQGKMVDCCPFSDNCDACLELSEKANDAQRTLSNGPDELCATDAPHELSLNKEFHTGLDESGIEDSSAFTSDHQFSKTDQEDKTNQSCMCLKITAEATKGSSEDINNELDLLHKEKRTHARCDSDDSGVVLRNNRLSRTSEDFDGSRENLGLPCSPEPKAESDNDCIMGDFKGSSLDDSPIESPAEEVRPEQIQIKIEDVENGKNSSIKYTEKESLSKSNSCTPRLEGEEHDRKTKELEQQIKSRIQPSDEDKKYQKEYEFWKYQIAAIQYDYVSRIHIRKFLLSATFNTEEDNYRLSLVREPPNRKTS